MRRRVYIWLLRLHPMSFRRQFSSEMLAIFDDPAAQKYSRGLLTDAMVSLVRQWVLRPEFRNTDADAVIPAGAPLFASFDDYRVRPAAVLYGGVLSVAVFCFVVFTIGNTDAASRWSIGAHRPAGGVLPVTRPSMEGPEPDTRVSLAEPEDPWRALASVYFKSMPVLEALDAGHDLVISASEIANAPETLRRLDRNHDGKLSAEECGFFIGSPELNAKFTERMRKRLYAIPSGTGRAGFGSRWRDFRGGDQK